VSTRGARAGASSAAPAERIRREIERWFLVEPLLFGAWTAHRVLAVPKIKTIRVQAGRIEYNPDFIARLTERELVALLQLEALRIVLGHPYQRRKADVELSYQASNITLQECLRTSLPVPRAHEVFGTHEHDDQYFDYYYGRLVERASGVAPSKATSKATSEATSGATSATSATSEATSATSEATRGAGGSGGSLRDYAHPDDGGLESAGGWDADDLFAELVREVVARAEENRAWGTIGGKLRERILAAQRPRVSHAEILRSFRTSILSKERYLTRMKPSRRYGFAYMGSRYALRSRLLFAIDVSGSMSSAELATGLSIVNQMFSPVVSEIDVIQFDTEIQGDKLTLKRARREHRVLGRGGTAFQPVIDYIDAHRDYDGLIVYTDGCAPVPARPKRAKTRIVWLFTHEATWRAQERGMRHLGRSAFVLP